MVAEGVNLQGGVEPPPHGVALAAGALDQLDAVVVDHAAQVVAQLRPAVGVEVQVGEVGVLLRQLLQVDGLARPHRLGQRRRQGDDLVGVEQTATGVLGEGVVRASAGDGEACPRAGDVLACLVNLPVRGHLRPPPEGRVLARGDLPGEGEHHPEAGRCPGVRPRRVVDRVPLPPDGHRTVEVGVVVVVKHEAGRAGDVLLRPLLDVEPHRRPHGQHLLVGQAPDLDRRLAEPHQLVDVQHGWVRLGVVEVGVSADWEHDRHASPSVPSA